MALQDTLRTNKSLPGDATPLEPSAPDIGKMSANQLIDYERQLIGQRQKFFEEEGKLAGELEIQKAKQMQPAIKAEVAAKQAAEEEYATSMKGIQELEFKPSQETLMSMAGIASLTAMVGLMLGKTGGFSGQSTIDSMTGMLKGYQQGKADIFKQEQAIFDKNVQAQKANAEKLKNKLEAALRKAATDRQGAEADIAIILAEQQSNYLNAKYKREGIDGAIKGVDQLITALNKRDELMRKASVTGGSKGITQQFMAQRAINALGGVASAVENVSKLPVGSTTGLLSYLNNKPGLLNYVADYGSRKISPKEAEAFDVLFTGVTRNLAAIEASGAATGLVGLSQQMEKLIPKAGQSSYRSALQLADMRRIAVENMQPLIDSGLLNPEQKQVSQKLVERIQKAIPYTTDELVQTQFKGKKTIGEKAEEMLTPFKSYATESDAQAAFSRGELKSGDKIKIGDTTGVWE